MDEERKIAAETCLLEADNSDEDPDLENLVGKRSANLLNRLWRSLSL